MSIKPQVISLPAELLTQIFALLPLLPDVLNLAATCKRLQEVWTNKLNTIYTSIAPKTILCQHDARRLLADSGGPSPGSPLSSPENVRSILHNSRIVEKAIVRFEQEVVPRVQGKLDLFLFPIRSPDTLSIPSQFPFLERKHGIQRS